jgi:hypothetical protein
MILYLLSLKFRSRLTLIRRGFAEAVIGVNPEAGEKFRYTKTSLKEAPGLSCPST